MNIAVSIDNRTPRPAQRRPSCDGSTGNDEGRSGPKSVASDWGQRNPFDPQLVLALANENDGATLDDLIEQKLMEQIQIQGPKIPVLAASKFDTRRDNSRKQDKRPSADDDQKTKEDRRTSNAGIRERQSIRRTSSACAKRLDQDFKKKRQSSLGYLNETDVATADDNAGRPQRTRRSTRQGSMGLGNLADEEDTPLQSSGPLRRRIERSRSISAGNGTATHTSSIGDLPPLAAANAQKGRPRLGVQRARSMALGTDRTPSLITTSTSTEDVSSDGPIRRKRVERSRSMGLGRAVQRNSTATGAPLKRVDSVGATANAISALRRQRAARSSQTDLAALRKQKNERRRSSQSPMRSHGRMRRATSYQVEVTQPKVQPTRDMSVSERVSACRTKQGNSAMRRSSKEMIQEGDEPVNGKANATWQFYASWKDDERA